MSGSRIYTRRGDGGETSLADGSRAPKHSPRVAAYGDVDEANSAVGLARACTDDPLLGSVLELLQHRLFNCSSNLASPPGSGLVPPVVELADVAFLEEAIDLFEARTGPLDHFVLPGGDRCAAYLHLARTTCRRAERSIAALGAEEEVDPLVRKLVNRASDLLFAAARLANSLSGRGDVAWDPALPRPDLGRLAPPRSR